MLTTYAWIGLAYATWHFVRGCRDLDAQRGLASLGLNPRELLVLWWILTLLVWPLVFVSDVLDSGRWNG